MATTFKVPKNNATSTLASICLIGDNHLHVAAGEGALFPSTYPFPLTIESEIVLCTNRSTDELTITRAQEGTAAAEHATASVVSLNITAIFVSDLNTAVNTMEATPYPGLVAATDPGGATLLHIIASVNGATAWSVVDIFDVTVAGTQAIGDSAAAGTATTAAHRNHKHAMPSAATMNSASVAAVVAAGLALAENTSVDLEDVLTADGNYTGLTMTGVAGATLAFGELVYLQTSDHRWEKASADNGAAGHNLRLGICVLAAANDNSATKILLMGTVRADTAFPDLTLGAPAFMSTTAGAIQVAAPSGTTDVVRIVGHGGYTKEELIFAPSPDYFALV